MNEAIQATELQEYKVEDLVDDAVATGAFDAYVYSYKQGGRTIEGLSARGVEHIAKGRGISIIDYEFIDKVDTTLGEGVLCVAMAKQVIKHPATKETQPDGTVIETEAYEEEWTAPGSRFEPAKDANGRTNPHCHQTALVKAMRNARLQLIELAARKVAIAELLKLQKAQPAPIPANTSRRTQGNGQRTQRPQNQNGNSQNGRDTARKAMYAQYNKRKAELQKLGITEDILKRGILNKYDVDSTAKLTEAQYVQVRKDLTGKFAKWITDLAPKTDDAQAESEIHY